MVYKEVSQAFSCFQSAESLGHSVHGLVLQAHQGQFMVYTLFACQ